MPEASYGPSTAIHPKPDSGSKPAEDHVDTPTGNPSPDVLSVLSVLSESPSRELPKHILGADQEADDSALLDLLSRQPMTYGAAATTVGWGATRTSQAETRLKAAGLLYFDKLGRATAKLH